MKGSELAKHAVIKWLVPEAIEFLLFTLENTYFPASAWETTVNKYDI